MTSKATIQLLLMVLGDRKMVGLLTMKVTVLELADESAGVTHPDKCSNL